MRYFLWRLFWALPTVIIVTVTVFALIRLIPGDPALLILGDRATPETLQALHVQLGLDKSLINQFFIWLDHVLHGDFGRSLLTNDPVLPLVYQRFITSIQVIFPAIIIAALIAVPLGILAAWKQNQAHDLLIIASSTLLLSIPTFWMGLLLLLLFGLHFQWLPIVGYSSLGDGWQQGLIYLLMPVATLVLHEVGGIVRMARSSTLEVLQLDYITHARAKGLSEGKVLYHHAFRNAFGPTWTLLGLILGNLLGGIAIVETIFTIPGLGRLLIDSILNRDYPVIQGCLLFISLFYVLVNLVIDLAYPLFDPRVGA